MTATEARQAALVEAAACIIEKACENRGCDELTIAEATTALENAYAVLALAERAADIPLTGTRALMKAQARAQAAEAQAQSKAAAIEEALCCIENADWQADDKPQTQAETQETIDKVYSILQNA